MEVRSPTPSPRTVRDDVHIEEGAVLRSRHPVERRPLECRRKQSSDTDAWCCPGINVKATIELAKAIANSMSSISNVDR
jgi:hypothetical protein